MTDFEFPGTISHMSLGVKDVAKAAAFYDAVLATLGVTRIMAVDGAIAYGRAYPDFWINLPLDNKPATIGNGSHVAFAARTQAEVDAFYAEALKQGATDEGAPGPRPDYGEPYYGAFVRDLDGHKIEATHWDMELARKLGMA